MPGKFIKATIQVMLDLTKTRAGKSYVYRAMIARKVLSGEVYL